MNELDLFVAAIKITEPVKRAEFLDRECASNPQMRQRIEALLSGNQASRHPLDVPPAGELGDGTQAHAPQSITSDSPPAEHAGAVIAGKYTLVEVIGEGGMGSVWRAKQSEPVKRFVAVKLIKAGMDSKQVLARFEAERQALAVMDHPNIAKVLDGGLHDGRPFFVMELIKGVPITDYCDKCKLTPKERLELFVPVCQAIQHAHQKGIIHRDIKPSNVLIALYDDKPVVKVIDFGVAKATGGTLTEHTIDTGFGGVVGTPQYMSPEQATFNNLDIDTRSDVYALGVLLYELLTGSPPFSKKDLEQKGLLEMLRVVREEEPPKPSTKLSTADALPTLSANRGTEPKKLTGLLRNELDWIVMKALEKDRTRRYETANGFAADVLRYLSGEAVHAHPPSKAYRLKKFVRRNKGQVIAASLVLLALLAGLTGTGWGLIEAKQQQRRAEAGEKLASDRLQEVEGEKQKVEQEKLVAEVVRRFLQHKLLGQADVMEQANALLMSGGASSAAKHNPTVRELLDRAAGELTEANIEAALPNQPVLQAELLNTIGNAYHGVGEADKAVAFLKRAVALRTAKFGPEHSDTLQILNRLAVVYAEVEKPDLAQPILEQILAVKKARGELDDPSTLSVMNNLAKVHYQLLRRDQAILLLEETFRIQKARLALDDPSRLTTMSNLAVAYRDGGNLDGALPLAEEVLRLLVDKMGPEHPQTLIARTNLGVTYHVAKKGDLALPLLEETLRVKKAKLGLEHPLTLTCRQALAAAYITAGKSDLALSLHEETFQLTKSKFGPDHPATMKLMAELALAYVEFGKRELALPLLEEALKLQKVKFGPDHPNTLASMSELASTCRDAGKLDRALPLFEETLKLRKATLGPDHPDTLVNMNNLASTYRAVDKLDLAVPLFEETVNLMKAKLGPDHLNTIMSMGALGEAYQNDGKLDRALPLLEETLKLAKAKLGPDDVNTLSIMNNLAKAYWQGKQFDKSVPLFEETVKRHEAKFGQGDPATFGPMANLGVNYVSAGKLDLALPLLQETLKLRKAKLGSDHLDTLESMYSLAKAYRAVNQLDTALPLYEEVLKLRKAKLGPDHPTTLLTMNNLASAYRDAGKLDRALPLLEEELELEKAKLGPDHHDTLGSMNNLAATYWSAKQLDKSIPLLEEALKRREAKLGRSHPETLFTAVNLGVNYKDAGRVAEALPLLEEAHRASKKHASLRFVGPQLLDAYAKAGEHRKFAELLREQLPEARKAMPKNSPQLAGLLAQIGMSLLEQKKWSEAEPLLRECLAIRENTQPDAWTTFNTQSLLGGALLGQKKYDDAEPLLVKGYEGMKARVKTIPPQGNTRLPEALDRLIDLYTATDKPDEAKKWRAERAKYPALVEKGPMPREVK